jgi:hypothetical protein
MIELDPSYDTLVPLKVIFSIVFSKNRTGL